jgi:pSer/pThr/pTyr-binding forkhead associated (FHA) protein
MAKLNLKFENAVLKEVTLSHAPATVGRLPDNTLQIDNLAVSGHHARVSWVQDHYEVEDLGSLNGTFVNDERVSKARLRHCDVVKIGKHMIEFRNDGPALFTNFAEKAGPATPKLDATVMLDTKHAQEVLSGRSALSIAGSRDGSAAAPGKERVGILSVVEGRTDQDHYILTSKMTMIGKSEMASIRLKGLFAPNSAALISKRETKYFIAPEHKVKVKINGEKLSAQRELAAGDLIEIGKLKAAFSFQD